LITKNIRTLKLNMISSVFFFSLLLQVWACKTDVPTQQQNSALGTDSSALKTPNQVAAFDSFAKAPAAVLDSNARVIYFTFDDGPLAPTPFLTEIITEKQIKISEFAVGLHAQMNKNFRGHLEAMRTNPLIELCNHSYSHAYGRYKNYYSNPQAAADEIMDNETKLNLTLKIVRLPGRCIWFTNTIKHGLSQTGGRTAEILGANGYRTFGWDYEWSHYGNTLPKESPEQFVANVDALFARQAMRKPNHLVLLGHDEMLIKEKGRQDLRRIIDLLKERGYIFEFISNFPDQTPAPAVTAQAIPAPTAVQTVSPAN
jgi:peptidoglycan/xylan/chitin deacetylase (PgdA/CDA1 family)